MLTQADAAQQEGDFQSSFMIYKQVLSMAPDNAVAYSGMIRTLLAAGQTDDASAMADNVPDSIAGSPEFTAVQKALALQTQTADSGELDELKAKLDKNPDDLDTRYKLGMALFAGGRQEDAIDEMIEIIRRDKEWEEEKARKQLLDFFEALGHSNPITAKGRRKLSSVLFS